MKRLAHALLLRPGHGIGVIVAILMVLAMSASPAVADAETALQARSWGERLVDRPGRAMPETFTPELITRCLEVAKDVNPRLAARLQQVRSRAPEDLERHLRQNPRVVELALVKMRDPSLYSLKRLELRVDMEVSRVARAIRDARSRGEPVASLQSELRGNVRLQVTFSFRAREDYVCRLQELVSRLEGELTAERQRLDEQFDTVVEDRIRRLLDEPVGDGGVAAAPPPASTALTASPTSPERSPSSSRLRPDRASRARGAAPPLAPELIDACLAVAADVNPGLAKRLRVLQEKDPAALATRLRRSPRIVDLAQVKRRDPNLYSLKRLELNVDMEVTRLVNEMREARRHGSDTSALDQQLLFYVRLQLTFSFRAREDYVRRLQELVLKMEKDFEAERRRLTEEFDVVVEDHMKALLAEPQTPVLE